MRMPKPFLHLLAAAALAAGPIEGAMPFPAADTSEIQAYVLTDSGLARFEKAANALKALAFQDCIVDEDEDDDAGPTSIESAVAKLEAYPGAKGAVQSAGMTSREFVVMTYALVQNMVAAEAAQRSGGRMLPGINPANVAFLGQHAADIDELRSDEAAVACGDGDDE